MGGILAELWGGVNERCEASAKPRYALGVARCAGIDIPPWGML
jgi:hypothetical protein